MSSTNGTILEDDQQLYDWGIENRLDQYEYYQEDPNANGEQFNGNTGGAYFPRNYATDRRQGPEYVVDRRPSDYGGRDSNNEYPSPPPAHQEPSYRSVQGGAQGDRRIKEEPGVDMSGWNYQYSRKPILPPGSPHGPGGYPGFSLDANEALKVERKRARNRIAASKCRMRKIEKIQTLDQQTTKLKQENDELAALAAKLKEQVYQLQQELQWHVNNGCQLSERAAKAAELLPDKFNDNKSINSQPQTKIISEQTASPDSTTISIAENNPR